MFESLPKEIIQKGLFCGWKLTDRGKVPYNLRTGELAKANDKTTFASYIEVLTSYENWVKKDTNGKLIGGFGLGIFNGISAVDIDHCVDENGEPNEMAQDIIDFFQSYTELSPSGTGIRILFKTNLKDFDSSQYYINKRDIGLEIYIEGVTSKFVTITGNTMLSSELREIEEAELYSNVLNKYMRKQTKKQSNCAKSVIKASDVNLDVFIQRDTKLNELWYKAATGAGGTESEDDLALCSKLAFYLQRDFDAIYNAFINSPYFNSKDDAHKNKWLLRDDYKQMTIQKAIDGCIDVYTPNSLSNTSNKLALQYNDTGNAHRFVEFTSGKVKYNVENKKWMIWNGKYWQQDELGMVKNIAEYTAEQIRMAALAIENQEEQKQALKNVNRMLSSSGKESMLKEAQHLKDIPCTNDLFDRQEYLFNCENGVYDLENFRFIPHDKNLMLNKISGVEYNEEADCPRFKKFMEEITDGNTEIVDFLQTAFGYSMTGSTVEQVMFFLTGDGSNGKSLLLQIIQEVLGDYSKTSQPEVLLDKKTQSQNLSEVARLKGVRMCVCGETKQGDKLNESQIKTLVGGNDKIVARFLYCNEMEFIPIMKIWMATNYEPIVRGIDNGIWRRLIIIPFTHIFDEQSKDKLLINKLRAEKSGILNWLIEGCKKWKEQEGLILPECLKNEKLKYRNDMDVVARFVDQECEVGNTNYRIGATNLYTIYKDYCTATNEYCMSQIAFTKNLNKKGFPTETNPRNRLKEYVGIQRKGEY